MPAVSVIIPAYNAAATLERALASVAKQTLSGIEILVVDDGSTDATPEILARMAAADRRLRILTQANGGVARARNAAIGAATGEWVATIDADDIWHPRKLELQHLQTQRPLSMQELYELRDLCRLATSHLVYSKVGK